MREISHNNADIYKGIEYLSNLTFLPTFMRTKKCYRIDWTILKLKGFFCFFRRTDSCRDSILFCSAVDIVVYMYTSTNV